ncbi:hypothetical protein [Oceanobacillus sp. CAU 1775]
MQQQKRKCPFSNEQTGALRNEIKETQRTKRVDVDLLIGEV